MGGARRDEEKARAKERFFSHRDEFGQWDQKKQDPEVWNLFNGRKHHGEHFRVFPISNWTEMDVWQYIKEENFALPSLYFSHERECVVRDEVILAKSEFSRTGFRGNGVLDESKIAAKLIKANCQAYHQRMPSYD